MSIFFFFQAEDGIRDLTVTGVQTCALPISGKGVVLAEGGIHFELRRRLEFELRPATQDRKSTRLNSSHSQISYAVFCLKKKKKHRYEHDTDHGTHVRTAPHPLGQAAQPPTV